MNWSLVGYCFIRFVLPLLLAASLFVLKKEKRKGFAYRLPIALLLFFVLNLLITNYSENMKIESWFYCYFLLDLLTVFLFLFFIFRISWKEALFFTVAAYSIQNLTDNLINLIYLSAGEPENLVLRWTVFLVPYLVTYCLFYFAFARLIKSRYADIMSNVLFLAILCIILGIVYVLSMYATLGSGDDSISLRIYAIISCGLSMLLQFNVFNTTYLHSENGKLETILKTENEGNLRYQKNYELLSMKIHNLRHQIRAIKEKTDSEEIQKSLAELEKDAHIFNTSLKTSSQALDSVLSVRSLYCAEKGITLSCMADGEKLSFLSDSDIFSLFSNAIDNGIEAVLKEPEEKRNITINVREKNGFLLIHFDNPSSSAVTFANGLPQTDKDKNDLHGYGSKSICYIVEKYGGKANFQQENGLFKLNIMIPMAQ